MSSLEARDGLPGAENVDVAEIAEVAEVAEGAVAASIADGVEGARCAEGGSYAEAGVLAEAAAGEPDGESARCDIDGSFGESVPFVVQLLASPGSGLSSLVLATVDALRDELEIGVLEAPGRDGKLARRLEAQGVAARAFGQALDWKRLDLVLVVGAPLQACLGAGAPPVHTAVLVTVPEQADVLAAAFERSRPPLETPEVRFPNGRPDSRGAQVVPESHGSQDTQASREAQVARGARVSREAQNAQASREAQVAPALHEPSLSRLGALVVNKADRLGQSDVNPDAFCERLNQATRQNAKGRPLPVFLVSSTTGAGVEPWATWLLELCWAFAARGA